MQNITPEDIENIIKTYQYRYVSLTNAKNKFGGYNKTPKDLKNKIKPKNTNTNPITTTPAIGTTF
jgi:hypothetical protein